MGRLVSSLAALLLGCSALTTPAHAGWLFGGSDDAAPKAAAKQAAQAPKPAPATDIEGNVRQARMLRQAGNYEEAIHHLAQLMLVASDDGRVVGEYGKTLVQMGRAQDARQFLTRAQQLTPGDWTIASALGVAYDELGDQAMARAAYERALTLRPDEPSVLNNYALSRLLAHDPDGARQLAGRASLAGGGADPKIKRNLTMIADIAPAPRAAGTPEKSSEKPQDAEGGAAPSQAAPKAAPAASVPVAAAIPAKAAPAKTGPAPARGLTAYAVSGTDPARPFVTLPAPANPARPGAPADVIDIAARPAATQPRGVVMQKVPVDPLAGPAAAKAAPAEAPPAKIPAAQTPAAKTPAAQAPAAKAPARTATAGAEKPAASKIPALRLSANAY